MIQDGARSLAWIILVLSVHASVVSVSSASPFHELHSSGLLFPKLLIFILLQPEPGPVQCDSWLFPYGLGFTAPPSVCKVTAAPRGGVTRVGLKVLKVD